MDNQMLGAHITIIADTLNHIDAVLTISMILLTINMGNGYFRKHWTLT